MLSEIISEKLSKSLPIKLHLGCGHQKLQGYLNIDGEFMRHDNDIIIHDISQPFPIPDNCVDEILTVHVIEHFSREIPPLMFKEFLRICKPGGFVATEWPDFLKMCKEVVKNPDCFWTTDKRLVKRTISGIYGDYARYPDPVMLHKWGYSEESMIKLLKEIGFSTVHAEPNIYPKSGIDSRVIAYK